MSDCIKVTVEAYVGTTVKSPNFFSVEETVPPGTTIADIEQGILDGIYTPIDPNLYTYKGQVRADYNTSLETELNLDIETVTIDGTINPGGTDTYDVVKFKILTDVTGEWENKEGCLLFDIIRTEIADADNVELWVKGNLEVKPTITME